MLLKEERITKEQRIMISVLIFLFKLILLSAPIYLILFFSIPLTPLHDAVLIQTVDIFSAAGFNPTYSGYMITVNKTHEFSFGIGEDCTPWKSIWLFFALIIAVPAVSADRRLLGFLCGFAILWAANLARIFFIVWTEQFVSYSVAMFIHDYLWKGILILVVLIMWIVWLFFNGKISRRRDIFNEYFFDRIRK